MKSIIVFALLVTVVSCKTNRQTIIKGSQEDPIVYIVQNNVEALLKEELVKRDKDIY